MPNDYFLCYTNYITEPFVYLHYTIPQQSAQGDQFVVTYRMVSFMIYTKFEIKSEVNGVDNIHKD